MAAIKDDKCSKCGACAKDCPYGAIEDTKEGILINASKCIGCGKCKSACGFDAIEIFAVKKTKFNITQREDIKCRLE